MEQAHQERVRRNIAAIRDAGLSAVVCALPANVLLTCGYWPIIGSSVAVVGADGRVGLVVPEDEKDLAAQGWADVVRTFSPGSLDKIYELEQVVGPALHEIVKEIGVSSGTIGDHWIRRPGLARAGLSG